MLHSFDIRYNFHFSLRLLLVLKGPWGTPQWGPLAPPCAEFPPQDLPKAVCPFLKVRLGL